MSRTTPPLPEVYLAPGSSSFVDFVRQAAPDVLAQRLTGSERLPVGEQVHATTIVAIAHAGGIVMAGDRRATMGSYIAHREIEKVFPADDFSAVGIAGTAGIGIELVRLFQLELEHYEKIEGALLSLEGKANRLGTMLRGNLGLALQGLTALPLFGGYDLDTGTGRLFSYDAVGGRYEERSYHAIGSGSVFARGSLKNLWRADLSEEEAVAVAVGALVDAADDDSATGGPDAIRGIYPVVAAVGVQGYRRVADVELAALVAQIDAARAEARRPA